MVPDAVSEKEKAPNSDYMKIDKSIDCNNLNGAYIY